MNISQKLTLTAIVSVVLMVLIGGTGLYVARGFDDALDNVNNRGIPGMRAVYEVKSHQQAMAIAIYRHILSNG